MIPAQAIPIIGQGNGNFSAGSSFLVSNGDKFWMLTCVHNVTGLIKTPISAFDPNSSIHVLGTNINIADIGRRNFGRVRLNDTPILVDCMSIPLNAAEINELTQFGAFNLTDIIPATLKEDVKFTGFPGMETHLIPLSSVQSRVSKIEGVSIQLDHPAFPGYSGGPLYTDNGLLGVMHGDVGRSPDFTNGLAISLDTIRDFMFS